MSGEQLHAGQEPKRDSEALYLSLVENLPVSVARKNLLGEITFANQAFCGMLDMTFAEVLGKTDYDLFPKDLADKYRRDDKWVQNSGKTFSDVEQNFSGGETHYFEVRKTPVSDRGGQIIGTQVIFWDVSAHKRAEAELDQERQLLNALLANTPDSIYFKDIDGCFIRISQAFSKHLALNHPADAVGKSDLDYFPPVHAERARQDEIQVMRSGRSLVSKEEEISWPNHATTWVSTTKAPLRNYVGDVIGTFGISRDITSRKMFEIAQREAKEAAEAASQAKGNFIAHMSHEIRTPMNAIIGLTDLALETNLDEKQRDYLSTVLASAEALLGIINQVLDFSKIDANKIELENVPFLMRMLVKDTVKSMEFRAKEKGIQLIWSVATNVPDGLRGDPTRFRQILTNLISNAIKFTEEGSVQLEIASQPVGDQIVKLFVAVVDTGIGIPKNKLKTIFDEFQQADSSTTRQYGGTGLGLAITTRLVELMHGNIEANSELGVGTSFRLELQFAVASEKQLAQLQTLAAETKAQAEKTRSLRILLAEDGLANQKLMVGLLENLGHRVRIASDGCEAVELWSSSPFDLVLMDLQMPEMDGLEACTAIRRLEQNTNDHIPIIAITAHATEDDRHKCLEVGMDDYLRKPIRKHELIEAIMNQFGSGDGETKSPQTPQNVNVVWNQNEAMDAVDGDEDLLKQVISAFLGECDTLMTQLYDAIECNDLLVVRRAAHTIKGGTRIFGSPSVTDRAQEIERHAANSESDVEYLALAKELQPELERLKNELRQYIA